MAKQDFLPNREDELIAWFNNYSTKLPNYQVLLGLTAAECFGCGAAELVPLGTVQNSPAFQRWESDQIQPQRPVGTREDVVRKLNTINDARGVGLPASRRDAIVRGGRGPSDESLGYYRAVPTGLWDWDCGRRILSPTAPVGGFGRRKDSPPTVENPAGAETAWMYLRFDSFAPYIDNRPPAVAGQTEQRRYRLRYRDNDVQVGEFQIRRPRPWDHSI